MWWHDRRDGGANRSALVTRRALLTAMAVVPLVAGCSGGIQPLYGPSFSGTNTADEMAAVDISLIPGRVGQVVRNELIFKTTGGSDAAQPKYRLEIALRESGAALLVKTNGENRGTMFALDADFKLYRVGDNTLLLDGKASSRAAFQRDESIFANVRARRDAEDRAARMIADDLRVRLAAYLATAT